MENKVWVAHFQENIGNHIHTACAIVRAPDYDTAKEMAKATAISVQIPFLTLEEFVGESKVVCANYDY